MLSASRYLLGIAEIGALAGFSWLGATSVRRRLVPDFSGAPAHLATVILALALLIWIAELLGSFGAFEPAPYLCGVALVGGACWALCPRVLSGDEGGAAGQAVLDPPHPLPPAGGASKKDNERGISAVTVIVLLIAAVAVVHFADGVRLRLDTGMTGFDSTWYHGPFAAGFAQSGDTWSLHYIAPQFLAWFYPANSELLHAVGMSAFDRDLLSPLLNLGWFVGCLVACWCIGRPYRVAPWSLALGAIALSVPALSDQAGEARNDIVGIFFLLAAVAIAVNATAPRSAGEAAARHAAGERPQLALGAVILTGLAAGLAAGTKLNFLLPCAVLVIGLAAVAPRGLRRRSLGAGTLAALAGGGYWYLRNLLHTGNPLPWFDQLGPISLPAPEQALGGREEHSVLGYLTDGSIWSDWFLPGFHHGVGILWPLLAAAALAGVALNLGRRSSPVVRVSALVGLAATVAWLVAPTSASGPDGMPRGFESGLRYLAPALILGAVLLPLAPVLRDRLARLGSSSQFLPHSWRKDELGGRSGRSGAGAWAIAGLGVAAAVVVAAGYLVQREYLRDRYANPTFTTPGLNAAFKWATPVSGARIATTSTRQYPLFGTDLSNRVEFVGEERPNGGSVAPSSCRAWRRLLDEGDYDYVVASRDRIEPGGPSYPATARWTEGPGATVVLRKPPTVVFRLNAPPDPATC
jgi:hypothetical protein